MNVGQSPSTLHTMAQWRLVAGQRSPGLVWSAVGRGERGVNRRHQRSTGSPRGRITEHCHWSTRVQTLHPSLHQEPSRILIASGLPYMKLQACLLDLPPRMHSSTHDLWQGVTMSRVRAEEETPELEMRMLAPAWSTNTATSATRRPVTITLHQTCSCGHCFHTISHCGRGVGTLTRGDPAACVARWVIRYLVTIDCTCLALPRTLYRKSMTICEIEVSCPVSSAAAAAVELPHR